MSGTIKFTMEVTLNRSDYTELEEAQRALRLHLADAIAFVSRGGLHLNLYDHDSGEQAGQCDVFIDKGDS